MDIRPIQRNNKKMLNENVCVCIYGWIGELRREKGHCSRIFPGFEGRRGMKTTKRKRVKQRVGEVVVDPLGLGT